MFLPTLLKKINNFYQTTLFSLAQDLGLYSKIQAAGHQIADASIASEVLLLGELYKKALELNGGYNYVNKFLTTLVNSLLDQDSEEESAVEDLMNEVSRDLRNRSKVAGADDPQATKTLINLKNNFNAEMLSQDISEAGKSVFDPTGGVGLDVGKEKGRGYFVESRNYKDWERSYQDEKDRLVDELKNSTTLNLPDRQGRGQGRNSATRTTIQELIDLLGKLIEQTPLLQAAESEFKLAPNETTKRNLEKLYQDVKELRQKRSTLRGKIKKYFLSQDNEDLKKELENIREPKAKFLLEHQIALNDLMTNQDTRKAEELKLRRMLINGLSEGRSLSADTIDNLVQKIEAAKLKRKTKDERMWQHVNRVSDTKATIPQYDEEGKRKRFNQYNMDSLELDGFVEHLQQRLNTAKSSLKQKITDKLSVEELKTFKPLLDDISKAQLNNNKSLLLANIKKLRLAMKDMASNQPDFIHYVISIRSSKFFLNFRKKINLISQWLQADNVVLTDEQKNFIKDTTLEGKQLINFYKNLKIKPITPGWKERKTNLKSPVEIVERIVKYLEGKIS